MRGEEGLAKWPFYFIKYRKAFIERRASIKFSDFGARFYPRFSKLYAVKIPRNFFVCFYLRRASIWDTLLIKVLRKVLFSKSDHEGRGGVKNAQKFDHTVYEWPLKELSCYCTICHRAKYLLENAGIVYLLRYLKLNSCKIAHEFWSFRNIKESQFLMEIILFYLWPFYLDITGITA